MLHVMNPRKQRAFGLLLKYERAKAGLSQAMLAQKAGVSVAIVNDIENAKRVAGVKTHRRIAEALEMAEHRAIDFMLQGLSLSSRDYALPGFEDYDPLALFKPYGSEVPSGVEITLSTNQTVRVKLEFVEHNS